MNLIEALQKQIEFCKKYEHYQCGVFVMNASKRGLVMDVISNLLPVPNRDVGLKSSPYENIAIFPNGSTIRILLANNTARGFRQHGQIIDNDISTNIVNCLIAPYLRQRGVGITPVESKEEVADRVYYTDISMDDVEQSKKYKRFASVEDWHKYLCMAAQIKMGQYKNTFEKEFKCMWNENNYDHAIVDKELNGARVLLYEAWGIPEDKITYETEFINKTKQTYLNIKGEYSIEDIGFENDLNVHLLIDTDIYSSFEVRAKDGMVKVELYEIQNEKPELKDLRK